MWENIKICSEGHDALTVNQMASVLCYWYNGIVPLPWTFKRDKIVNRYVMNYGAGGVVRVIDKGQKWKCSMDLLELLLTAC